MIEHTLIATLSRNPETHSLIDVTPAEFVDAQCAQIYAVVSDLAREGIDPDPILVAEKLNEGSDFDWWPIVGRIMQADGVASNVEHYARAVRQGKRKEELKRICDRFAYDIAKGDSPESRVIDAIRELDTTGPEDTRKAEDFAGAIVAHIDAVQEGNYVPGLPTGIPSLDKLIDGLRPGKLYIVAARTSVGKTAFACNLAVNCKAPALFISGEMTGEEITGRFMAKIAGISAFRIESGRLRADEIQKLPRALEGLKALDVDIVDRPRLSIDDIERTCRSAQWKREAKGPLFIDYLQLIANPAYDDKRLQISDISARCKALARELQIPVVLLAQLNRNADGRPPRLSDLKESGSIEEDADVVILLAKSEHAGKLTIDLAKHRGGPTHHWDEHWNAEYMRVG